MAAPTTTDRRIEIGLDSIGLALDDLADIAREWETLEDGERASWSLDWDHLMGTYLRLIAKASRLGLLNDDQQHRYDLLRDRLAQASPIIERLQLYPPELGS
jgi:hypothetical protein